MRRCGGTIAALPEVLEAYLTTGECIISSVSASQASERVRHSRSCFALKCLKCTLSVVPDATLDKGGIRRHKVLTCV